MMMLLCVSCRPAPAFREGDWYCKDCNTHNFASRSQCFKCSAQRD
jgi:hypothetical protein